MDKLLDYVMIENIFTEEECKNYISQLDTRIWRPHTWYKNNTDEYRTMNDFNTTYDVKIQSDMKESVMKFAAKYFLKYRDSGDPEWQFSGVRFNRYDTGESIQKHVDHIHSCFDGKKRGIPVLSFLGLFNDDYEGGDFILCNQKIDLKAGDCIIFPSVFLYPHEVTPVTKGTRYSWVLWSW